MICPLQLTTWLLVCAYVCARVLHDNLLGERRLFSFRDGALALLQCVCVCDAMQGQHEQLFQDMCRSRLNSRPQRRQGSCLWNSGFLQFTGHIFVNLAGLMRVRDRRNLPR